MEDSTIKDALTTLGDFLAKKDYAGAEKFWLTQSDIFTDSSYWHNLGVIYKLQNKLPHARFAFEKANHLSVYSSATLDELALVEEKLGVTETSADPSIGELVTSLGPYKLSGLCVLLSLMGLAFLHKKLSLLHKFVTLVIAFIPLLCGLYFFHSTVAFVTIRPVELYSGASQLYASGKTVPEGVRLVGVVKGDWIAVHSQSGDVFWLKAQDVKGQSLFLWD